MSSWERKIYLPWRRNQVSRSRVGHFLAIEDLFSAPLIATRAGTGLEKATTRGAEGLKSVHEYMHPCAVNAQAEEGIFASPQTRPEFTDASTS